MARRRAGGRNFDNDDYSRDGEGREEEEGEEKDGGGGGGEEKEKEEVEEEEVSVDRTNYWLQSGYAGGNGASPKYIRGGEGGGASRAGSGSGSSGNSSRGGSATAEESSWNPGMMGGASSRSGGSSRCGSGSGVRPAPSRRRYLVEQNQFRQQGW